MGSREGRRMRAANCRPEPRWGAAAPASRAWPEEWVAIARVMRPWGRRGEVLADLLTDFPTRFKSQARVFLEGVRAPVRVESAWLHQGRVVLKFSGTDSISQAEQWRGRNVLIPREERMPLPPHCYYRSDLRGCRVVRETGQGEEMVGTVEDIEPTGGVDLLRVKVKGGRTLIPLAEDICLRIDIGAKKVVIDPPEWLLESNP